MRRIDTTRFGSIEIEEEKIIHFPQGILGFPEQKDYILFPHKPDSPFYWLQSVTNPELAFVLTNPFLFFEDYLSRLTPAEEDLLKAENGGEVNVFVLVTIPQGKAEEMTANLLGPLVIEVETRVGRQVVLPNSGYSHRHPLLGG
ncbi:MAG: flagellar assembly protein FliW [Deltaproteobacteria bacterium]|nr:flagellar assembly protein FliW [Deltaproteobacteria bacterium]MBW2015445.1 flagellar assembly protein FliW [Deltaproteobacteria bacterium]MBW2129663.1 flagellar assembly protein FliW [Deltaproteobacteria bacterium]MBW2302813.1 flagellar assembly protein FliW [Deltaproteobacteria bacterium]